MISYFWRQIATPSYFAWLLISFLSIGLYLLAATQSYIDLMPTIISLNNQHGITDLAFKPVASMQNILLIFWSIFVGSKFFAYNRANNTHLLMITQINCKLFPSINNNLFQLLISCFISTAVFWLAVLLFSFYIDFDQGQLFAFFISQVLFSIYATLLSSFISIYQKQVISASLLVALIWANLWFLPTITTQPLWLVSMLQWFSPFSHLDLLLEGILTSQTIIFFLIHYWLFYSLIILKREQFLL